MSKSNSVNYHAITEEFELNSGIGTCKIFTPWANIEHKYYIEFRPYHVDVLDESSRETVGILIRYSPDEDDISEIFFVYRNGINHRAKSYTDKYILIVNVCIPRLMNLYKENK